MPAPLVPLDMVSSGWLQGQNSTSPWGMSSPCAHMLYKFSRPPLLRHGRKPGGKVRLMLKEMMNNRCRAGKPHQHYPAEYTAPSCVWQQYYTQKICFNYILIPLSLGVIQIPTCCYVGYSTLQCPAHCCSLALRWHKYVRPPHKHSGQHAAAAEAGWRTSCCDGGRIWATWRK